MSNYDGLSDEVKQWAQKLRDHLELQERTRVAYSHQRWLTAALLYARVEIGSGDGVHTSRQSVEKVSARRVAALGLPGLRSQVTVIKYVKTWQWAVDHGVAPPQGSTFKPPKIEFPAWSDVERSVSPREIQAREEREQRLTQMTTAPRAAMPISGPEKFDDSNGEGVPLPQRRQLVASVPAATTQARETVTESVGAVAAVVATAEAAIPETVAATLILRIRGCQGLLNKLIEISDPVSLGRYTEKISEELGALLALANPVPDFVEEDDGDGD